VLFTETGGKLYDGDSLVDAASLYEDVSDGIQIDIDSVSESPGDILSPYAVDVTVFDSTQVVLAASLGKCSVTVLVSVMRVVDVVSVMGVWQYLAMRVK